MGGRVTWYGCAAVLIAWMVVAHVPLAQMVKPDDFAFRPYGWFTNQSSHVALGVAITTITSLIGWWLITEYPYRMEIGVVVVALIGFFEVGVQGWQGVDTVNDITFMLYGALGSLLAFKEAEVGGVEVDGNPLNIAMAFPVVLTHLTVGSLWR
jgi:hypothetical protein